MPYVPVRLNRSALPVTSTTLYTATGNVIVKQIALANTTTAQITCSVSIGGIGIFNGPVAANSTTVLDLSQVIVNTDTITGNAGATGVGIHISGVTF